jgi:hypothetical protein
MGSEAGIPECPVLTRKRRVGAILVGFLLLIVVVASFLGVSYVIDTPQTLSASVSGQAH